MEIKIKGNNKSKLEIETLKQALKDKSVITDDDLTNAKNKLKGNMKNVKKI